GAEGDVSLERGTFAGGGAVLGGGAAFGGAVGRVLGLVLGDGEAPPAGGVGGLAREQGVAAGVAGVAAGEAEGVLGVGSEGGAGGCTRRPRARRGSPLPRRAAAPRTGRRGRRRTARRGCTSRRCRWRAHRWRPPRSPRPRRRAPPARSRSCRGAGTPPRAKAP